MNHEISVGDVVRIKSGGPTMTVEGIDLKTRRASCRWFDGLRVRASTFAVEALEPATKPGTPQ